MNKIRVKELQTEVLLVLLFALLIAVSAVGDETVSLKDLDPDEGVKESGKRLMQLPHGLHRLEPVENSAIRVLIGVHGYRSEGYEWVYPLQTMDDEETTAYFYRWDYSECPQEASKTLVEAIETLLKPETPIKQATIVGHSLGGVLVSALVQEWPFELPTDLHTVAAPLAGLASFSEQCGKFLPERIPTTIRFIQWRTQHKLDGAYKDLAKDPQVVSLDGSIAITLPETYRDRRLGHNWAVSWVSERIASAKETE